MEYTIYEDNNTSLEFSSSNCTDCGESCPAGVFELWSLLIPTIVLYAHSSSLLL
jgi:NAD-dependent dihydropyrimidine dehydrogenase PreA subunit